MRTKAVIANNLPELAKAIGLSPTQAAEIEIRSALCDKLISIVGRGNLTHAHVARAAGTSRTRLTAILNRNLHGVSTDLLLRIIASLGYRARINLSKIKPAA